MAEDHNASPVKRGHIAGPRGFLPLNEEPNLMVTHGHGVLSTLIQSRSYASLHALEHQGRRPSSAIGVETFEDEEAARGPRRPGENEEAYQERRAIILNGPQMRSMRLIGNSNPRYNWKKYWKTEEELSKLKRPIREYYERTNSLIQQYIYIDRLLDSSLPHSLLNEYTDHHIAVPSTISEEALPSQSDRPGERSALNGSSTSLSKKVKRTPREIYRVPTEDTPLLEEEEEEEEDELDGPKPEVPGLEDDSVESGDKVVQVAIFINLIANAILLAGKLVVIVLTSSLSVLASLVDAALDFLSTAIVWTTTRMIARQDQYQYPVGRRRLEPIGVLVFSVVIVTSFLQVGLQCFNRLTSDDHSVINLGLPAIVIMTSTILIKALSWLWCRLIKNSSVQALAQDAMTDVVFNIFSIIFPLVGYYLNLWWMDSLGGLLLSIFVIVNWAGTSASHIRNLTGAAATADERNVLLYLTMRFAKTIKQIQGLQAYHSGDKLMVEVDIVLDETTSLRDSHDLGESLQYVLESVPTVDRAFVHQDYASYNLPSHMQQQAE